MERHAGREGREARADGRFDLVERPRRDAANEGDEPVEAELVVVGIRGLGDAVRVEDEEVADARVSAPEP